MGQLEDMDTFIQIVETGSISQAADKLGVVKSAVSRRLVNIETRLGVQLINRTTRRSSLTEAGQIYYEKSLLVLGDVAELNAITSNENLALSGTIKVSAPLSFGLLHLTPIILEFAELHPDLIIHMDFNDRSIDLIEEGYDMEIRIGDLKDSTLMAQKLSPIQRILCASSDYLAKKCPLEKMEDLKDHDILHYSNISSTWHYISPEGQSRSISLPSKMRANNGDFLKEAAKKGHGIIISPTFIVWKELQEKSLIPILSNHHFSTPNAYAVYPQTRHLTYKVRIFINFLKKKFRGKPYWDKV